MAVDKNLFLYDLAVVAIMKNEAPYAKEWLDYHLLAGVDHFYIYDNESPDNLKEVLQPYINAGIVTYKFYPGKARQYEAYNEAVQEYKFACRYIAFIDGDEFIFPQNNKMIVEVVDEILNYNQDAGGLAVNIFNFGSNYKDEADYSKGVLERFTRRASVNFTPPLPGSGIAGGSAHVSTITDPRKVLFFYNPHFACYFKDYHAINEKGGIVPMFSNNPPTVDKIRINHYRMKSREEYTKKVNRGTADAYHNIYDLNKFSHDSPDNAVFDDSILYYVKNRKISVSNGDGGQIKQIDYAKCCDALFKNLSPTFEKDTPQEFYSDKMETFLTCRKLAEKLRENVIEKAAKKLSDNNAESAGLHTYLLHMMDKTTAKVFEETALKAVYKSLNPQIKLSDMQLFISELPNILKLNYPVVTDIRQKCIELIPQILNFFRIYDANAWREFVNLKYIMEMLKTFDSYERKK